MTLTTRFLESFRIVGGSICRKRRMELLCLLLRRLSASLRASIPSMLLLPPDGVETREGLEALGS